MSRVNAVREAADGNKILRQTGPQMLPHLARDTAVSRLTPFTWADSRIASAVILKP